jgi:hypothetical protein
MEKTEQINLNCLEEYGSEDPVRKYTTGTAGFDINYLLRNDYAKSVSQRRGFLLARLTAAPYSIALVRLWESDE